MPEELILEGFLKLILEVSIEGTKLIINSNERMKEIIYQGIILPDSIKHKIQVYKKDDKIILYDKELERWYL